MQRVTRGLLIVVMALWLAVPLLQLGKVAQDGSAFVAAGRLGRSNLPAAYMTAHGLQPAFVKEACHLGVEVRDCGFVVPFLSPPQLVPLLLPLRLVPGRTGVFLVRMLGVLAFVAAGALAWRKRRGVGSELPLVFAAVLLTPVVKDVSQVGQVGGVMLLSSLLSPDARSAVAARLGWLALMLVGLFKLLPFALLLTIRSRRVWLATAALLGVLSVGVLLIDRHVVSQFLVANRHGVEVSGSTNLSIDGIIARHWGGWTVGSVPYLLALVARLGCVVVADRRWLRGAPVEVRWSWRWCALLWLVPLVWWFYPVVIVGLAVSVCARVRTVSPWWIPASAALVLSVDRPAVFSVDVRSVWLLLVVGGALAAAAVACRPTPRAAIGPVEAQRPPSLA